MHILMYTDNIIILNAGQFHKDEAQKMTFSGEISDTGEPGALKEKMKTVNICKNEAEERDIPVEFAPMEGIALWPMRRAHAECFGGVDRYYTPFIAANSTRSFKTREKKEIDPLHNEGLDVVPQILTNDAGAFLWAAAEIGAGGYPEVDFNLGCPSPTVVTHGKGAGFLKDQERLDRFFDAVFEGMKDKTFPKISVKTRIGFEREEEASGIAAILGRYPFSRVIIHPRLRTDYYGGKPRMEVFSRIFESCPHPVVYNGDLTAPEDVKELLRQYPGLAGVMIGRGLLANPSLARELAGGEPFSAEELRRYHDTLLDYWLADIPEFSGVVGKMKELWHYMGPLFPDGKKQLKKIRKSGKEQEYRAAVSALFDSCGPLPPEERGRQAVYE